MSIANYFTLIRILISPIFLLVYVEREMLGISIQLLPFVLFFLVAVSELSDAFDGYLARRYNQVTDLGKILDPMADSIARISVFLTFTQNPVNLPLPLIFIFFYRDSIVSTLRTICALKGFALAARKSGKIKAGIQAMAIFLILLLMIPYSLDYLTSSTFRLVSTSVVTIAAIYTTYSAIDYIYYNRDYINKMLTFSNKPSREHQVISLK